MHTNDTIAAIATPAGEGGVGIIRISGPVALKAALKVFVMKGSGGVSERYLHYGVMKDPSGTEADDGFLVFMKGPRSYTGEDVVELNCHGGALVLKKVLEAVLKSGARLAEPGEFTKRAFLNGRLDLAQAEAVIDLIRASTEAALASAKGRLDGELSKRINSVKETLAGLVAHIEAELDFPEDEVEALPKDDILDRLSGAGEEVKKLLSTYDEGRVVREGVRAVILGRPNVGKSSLLNILLREERAIVTPEPGTTRDVIEEILNIRGIPVRLMDTAGLRETSDAAESIGIRVAKDRTKDADLVIFVVDASSGSFDGDIALLKEIEGKKAIVAANKTDLAGGPASKVSEGLKGYSVKFISALTGEGIESLKDGIYKEATGHPLGRASETRPGEMVVSLRHKTSLERGLEGILRAVEALKDNAPRELVATDIRWSLDRLGEITGETTTEDILERIFSTFCIGK